MGPVAYFWPGPASVAGEGSSPSRRMGGILKGNLAGDGFFAGCSAATVEEDLAGNDGTVNGFSWSLEESGAAGTSGCAGNFVAGAGAVEKPAFGLPPARGFLVREDFWASPC